MNGKTGSWLAAVLAGCALLGGCGGPASHPVRREPAADPMAFADRVCGAARQAATKAAGSPLSVRVVSPGAADLRCVLAGRRVTVSIESQAGPRAYTEFNTELSHLEQVFDSALHEPGQVPSVITVPGSSAAVWVRAQGMVVATDGANTQSSAGTYVTVTVKGPAALRVARAAARGVFAAHPDG